MVNYFKLFSLGPAGKIYQNLRLIFYEMLACKHVSVWWDGIVKLA